MIFRYLLITCFVLSANIVVQHKALANDPCSITLINGGRLVGNLETKPTKLVTTTEEMLGKISVTCTENANLTVSPPIPANRPEIDLSSSFVTVKDSSNNFTNSKGASPLRISANTPTILTVDLVIDKGSPLRPGYYKYNVRFNVLP